MCYIDREEDDKGTALVALALAAAALGFVVVVMILWPKQNVPKQQPVEAVAPDPKVRNLGGVWCRQVDDSKWLCDTKWDGRR